MLKPHVIRGNTENGFPRSFSFECNNCKEVGVFATHAALEKHQRDVHRAEIMFDNLSFQQKVNTIITCARIKYQCPETKYDPVRVRTTLCSCSKTHSEETYSNNYSVHSYIAGHTPLILCQACNTAYPAGWYATHVAHKCDNDALVQIIKTKLVFSL